MSETPLRLVFAGTPEFAAVHLQHLLQSEHEVVAVYTQPDRPAGRGKKLTASPVKQLALEAGIEVKQPASLKHEDAQAELAALNADAMIVVAYGLILPQAILDTPRLGCLNVHASLLPRWRGAAPIQRAIQAGDSESGVTIMQMDAGLDTGDMLATGRCAITAETTAASLHDALAELGAPLLLEVLSDLPGYQGRATSQDDGAASYAAKIEKSEARLDWQRSAEALSRDIRAFNPFPICFAEVDGERIKVQRAAVVNIGRTDAAPGRVLEADARGILVQCGEGQLSLQVVQLPGRKALPVAELLRGNHPFNAGTTLD